MRLLGIGYLSLGLDKEVGLDKSNSEHGALFTTLLDYFVFDLRTDHVFLNIPGMI